MKHMIHNFIQELAHKLEPIYQHPDEQTQVAWWLLEKLTGQQEALLLAHSTFDLTEEQEETLRNWLHDHVKNHKPLQYILGSVPFDDLEILVAPPTLIPRPETEEWCLALAEQLKRVHNKLTILDLCTGSGCIALALAKKLPSASIYGTDISDAALSLAEKNAHHNTIRNVTFIKSDFYAQLPSSLRFDCIVSNPPYISSKEWNNLDPMVTQWEDKQALVAEHHGLAAIEKIIAQAPEWLKENNEMAMLNIPQLVIEIGYRQGNNVKEIMHNHLFKKVHIHKDLEGKDRVVTGRI